MTNQSVPAENYPFCTIDPTEARCPVPDQRFNFLCDLYQPLSKVPAVLSVTDIAGLIKGAAEGAGLGNAFLSHIAAVDGIFHLLRAFDNDAVVHVDDSIDPVSIKTESHFPLPSILPFLPFLIHSRQFHFKQSHHSSHVYITPTPPITFISYTYLQHKIRDLETISSELCLKDMELLASAKEKAYTEARKQQGIARAAEPKGMEAMSAVYDKVLAMLEQKIPVGNGEWTAGEVDIIKEWFPLITTKVSI
jgi:ribosome-binding ATPase YchF (GTP1/OBG family)